MTALKFITVLPDQIPSKFALVCKEVKGSA